MISACGDSSTPISSTITLSSDSQTLAIGWFGGCNTSEGFSLDTIKDKLKTVLMINEFGVGFATWVPEPQSWAPNAFDKLNPGHSYYIVFAEVAA